MPPAPAAGGAQAAFPNRYCGVLRFLTRRTSCAEMARKLAHETWLRPAERTHGQRLGEGDHPSAPATRRPSPATRSRRAYLYAVAAHLANLHWHEKRSARWFVQPGRADAPAEPLYLYGEPGNAKLWAPRRSDLCQRGGIGQGGRRGGEV